MASKFQDTNYDIPASLSLLPIDGPGPERSFTSFSGRHEGDMGRFRPILTPPPTLQREVVRTDPSAPRRRRSLPQIPQLAGTHERKSNDDMKGPSETEQRRTGYNYTLHWDGLGAGPVTATIPLARSPTTDQRLTDARVLRDFVINVFKQCTSADVVSRRQERPIVALKNPAFKPCKNPLLR